MRKSMLLVVIMLVIAVVVAGCGTSNNGNKQNNATPQNVEKNNEENKGESKEVAARKSDKLSVYSPHQTEIINPIVKEFQDRTGITVELVTGGTGELLSRVSAEKGNPLGDVFWGGGAESLEAFSENFEPYISAEDANIPDQYKSPNHNWIGFSALPMVTMYNKDMVSEEDVPKTWAELLDPKWKGLIAYADPGASGSSYTQLVTMLFAHDNFDAGWDYVNDFIANLDGKILSGSSMVFQGVADGEFPIGITLEEAAYRYIAGGASVGVVYPEEGTSAVPDGMAIISGAKNEDNAKEFIDFLASKDVQELIVKEFNRRSIRDDVGPPEGLIASADIPLVDYDFNWSAGNKDDVITKFKDIVIGK